MNTRHAALAYVSRASREENTQTSQQPLQGGRHEENAKMRVVDYEKYAPVLGDVG